MSACSGSSGSGKSSAMRTAVHSRPLDFVDRRNGDLGVVFSAELREGGEDDVDAVFVDDIDEGLKIAAGRIVLSVVLHFAPTREQHQFVVGGAAAVLKVSCGESEVLKSFAVSDERDATSATELAEDLGHCAAVGAAQDGLRVDDSGGRRRSARGGGDGAGDVGRAGDAQGLPGDGQPPVGLDGYGGAEAERLRERREGASNRLMTSRAPRQP